MAKQKEPTATEQALAEALEEMDALRRTIAKLEQEAKEQGSLTNAELHRLHAILDGHENNRGQRQTMIERQSLEITVLKKQIDAMTTERQDLRLKLGVDEQLLVRARNEVAPLLTFKQHVDDLVEGWKRTIRKAVGEYRGGGWNQATGKNLDDILNDLRILGYG
jgi:polyhydroxyalkanoate synthesis regulator phasin